MRRRAPLLLLIFNRPETTSRVFAEIRKARPEKLFIAADGPRVNRPDDIQKCAEARDMVSKVDWPCEVKTLFRDSNLGCKKAVSSGIDWFFNQVEEGIILEDDCVPDQSFFPFCEELLERYRTDEKVMMISGFNATGEWPVPASYIFSKYTAVWGWATWKRAWKKYDVTMSSWALPESRKIIKSALGDHRIWKIKQWTYDRLHAGLKDTWDYQWEYALLLNGGVSIVPTKNLIENIGFGGQATHTPARERHSIPKASAIELPLIHPQEIKIDEKYDSFFTRRWKSDGSLLRRILARMGL